MNFYKHYIGDFQRDTGHLSLTERGAYRALLDAFYASEKPLPKAAPELCRLVGAFTKAERDAIVRVLKEFWQQTDDGWVNGRALKEIAKAGHQREVNRGIAEAREAARRSHEQSTNRATTASPIQTPDTRLQTVLPTSSPESRSTPALAQAPAREEPARDVPRETEGISPPGQACRAMRDAGCLDVNPSHPNLLAALAEGVTPQQLGDLAREMPGKRFAYLVATARSRRVDVPAVAAAGGGRIGAARPTLLERLDAITTEPSL